MTTTSNWIISEVGGPPLHPRLKARYDEAQRAGAPVRVFLAAPPPVSGGLQRHLGVETLVASGHAWQADATGNVAEGEWDEARRVLRDVRGRELDLFGRRNGSGAP